MLLNIFSDCFSRIWLVVLNVTGSNSFPKTLKTSEEQEYLQKIKSGDEHARQILIEHNLRLVAHIVKKYYSLSGDSDDLVSIGTIGLIKGIDSFNPDKGARLSSYISRCIENEILMFFRASKKNAQDVSISDPIDTDKDGNALTLIDVIATEDTIIDDLDIKIKTESLEKYINESLSEREKIVIILRYGINGQKPLTQRDVAKKLGISRSYVSRIEKRALLVLRKRYE